MPTRNFDIALYCWRFHITATV